MPSRRRGGRCQIFRSESNRRHAANVVLCQHATQQDTAGGFRMRLLAPGPRNEIIGAAGTGLGFTPGQQQCLGRTFLRGVGVGAFTFLVAVGSAKRVGGSLAVRCSVRGHGTFLPARLHRWNFQVDARQAAIVRLALRRGVIARPGVIDGRWRWLGLRRRERQGRKQRLAPFQQFTDFVDETRIFRAWHGGSWRRHGSGRWRRLDRLGIGLAAALRADRRCLRPRLAAHNKCEPGQHQHHRHMRPSNRCGVPNIASHASDLIGTPQKGKPCIRRARRQTLRVLSVPSKIADA